MFRKSSFLKMDELGNNISPSNFNLCSSDTDLVLSYLITALIENWFGLLTDQVKLAKLHSKGRPCGTIIGLITAGKVYTLPKWLTLKKN